MIFFIGMLIVIFSAMGVVYKAFTAYMPTSIFFKLFVLFMLYMSWFAPVWLRWLQKIPNIINNDIYDAAYKLGYFMMGFVLILSIVIIARDILWYVLYFISGKQSFFNPDNAHHINITNIWAIALSLLFSFYGVFEAHKTPVVKELFIQDARITQPLKFVVASDFHINRSTPKWHIQKMIDVINAQNPDYILLVGDIADDDPTPETLEKFKILTALKAKKTYISLGNHEYYHKPYTWMIEFSNLKFEVLQNSGEHIADTGVYVAGVPDTGSSSANYKRAFQIAGDSYKILLSHSPADFKELDKNLVDIQFSGHTHGGQIFPFQFITKKANNGYLSGLYEDGGKKLFVMKGAGYWGPPMRIFAEPDIAVLTLEPKK